MPQLGLARKELPGFQGVNLRQDRLSLADVELAKAINADLHTFLGVVVLRLGRRQFYSSALTDLVVRRLAKVNGFRYQVAGQSLYRDQTRIINGLLSSSLFTTMIPFRPLNDNQTWNFIADNSVMRKDSGTKLMVWGIAKPTLDFSLAEGPQERRYGSKSQSVVVTYTRCRFNGLSLAAEGNPADDMIFTFSTDATSVWIGDVQDGGTTVSNGFGFYRSILGGTLPLLDSRVSIGDQATWLNAYAFSYTWEASHVTDSLQHHFTYDLGDNYRGTQSWEYGGDMSGEDANGYHATHNWEINDGYVTTQALRFTFGFLKTDTQLSTAVERDNDPPPNAAWATQFQETVFLCRDNSNKHYLWFSKRFLPEAFPLDNFIEIGNPEDPLQCAIPNAGLLGVFTVKTKYRVYGNAASGYVADEALSHRGTPAPQACVGSEYGIIFPSRDGIFATNMISPDQAIGEKIEPLFYGETVNDMSPINWDAISTAAAERIKGRYYFAYPSGASSHPDTIAVFSSQTKQWYFYDHPMTSLSVEDDLSMLMAGGTNGFVYVLEEGATDAGANIALDVETRDYAGEERDTKKLFFYFKVDADTLGDDLTVKFYVDGVLKRTTTVNGARNEPLLSLPEGSMGKRWRARFQYTGSQRIKIYGVSAFWLPLAAA